MKRTHLVELARPRTERHRGATFWAQVDSPTQRWMDRVREMRRPTTRHGEDQ